MACAGRASSEGKFGTATAENGLLLQGEWVYDYYDGQARREQYALPWYRARFSRERARRLVRCYELG
jgi:hypothetical protein